MKKLILTTFIALACFSMQAQQSALTVKPAKIQAGKEVQFTYTSKLAKEGTTVWIRVYTLKKSFTKPYDFECINNKLEGTFNIPDSAVYILFSFSNDEEKDPIPESSPGYGYLVYNNNKPAKGAFLMQGNSYCEEFYPIVDATKAIKLMKKEFSLNSDLKEQFIGSYLYAISKTKNGVAKSKLMAQQLFNKGMANGKDKKLPILTYFISDGNKQIKDSLMLEVVKRFPNGWLNFQKRFNELSDKEDPEMKLLKYNSLLHDFPDKCESKKKDLDKILTVIYREKKDYANFDKCIAKFNDNTFLAEQYNEIAWEMVLADKDLPLAKTYSGKCLATMDLQRKEEKPAYFESQKEWEQYLDKKTGNYTDTYAFILYKLGDKKQAVDLQLKAEKLTLGQNPEINERLIQFLSEDNQMKEVLTKAEGFIVTDKSTVKIDSLYRVAYMAVNGSDSGLKEAQNKLALQMKDAPDFTLKTLDGRTVKLSDLKGKVVVLDFWATWCGPCKASFPGMQKAVDAFKDDKEVCFYFINTSERTSDEKRREGIQKTMKDKKVNFEVLLDEKDGDDFLVSKLYNVQGIPVKFIIDKNGKIRSTRVGFNGNDDELVKELKAIISELK